MEHFNKAIFWYILSNCLCLKSCSHQTTIEIVTTCKYLDILMCYNLKWNDLIKSEIWKIEYSFKSLSDVLENEKIRVVYQALVESNINYIILIWRDATIKLYISIKMNTKYNFKNCLKKM